MSRYFVLASYMALSISGNCAFGEPTAAPVQEAGSPDVLGVLRARISGGAILFNQPAQVTTAGSGDSATVTVNSDQFGSAAMYLAFESQPRLFSWTRCAKSKDDSSKCMTPTREYDDWYIDPIINIRLTAIPVVALTDKITAPGVDFLKSQKAAQFGFGAVATRNFGGLAVGSHKFHLGAGPVFRAMMQSVTNSDRALRLWNLTDDLYDAQTIGVRLSIFEQVSAAGVNSKTQWRPTAYIDFSQGKFQNFETPNAVGPYKACLDKPGKCLSDYRSQVAGAIDLGRTTSQLKDDFGVRKNWRTYIEARLYVNYLYVGFDINNGAGRDDVRFIGGVSVSLDRYFKAAN
jgi:hypothetical protein